MSRSCKLNNELRGPARGEYVAGLVRADPPPGVLAYHGDDPVGWAAVAPRADTSFARNRKIPHVDDLPVWICSFAMVLGRLEIFTLLVLLTPQFWQE